jgi:hypothetical protein
MRIWNTFFVGLCLAAMPSAAVAQGIAKNLDELRLLVRAGETVSVTDVSRNETSGKILSLSASTITLEVDGRPREFKESEVSRITQRRGDPLGNGALWGLAAGAGVIGLSMVSTADEGDEGIALFAAAVLGGIGAAIGAGIDALITRRQVIFEPPAGATAVSVVPLMTGGRRGALIRIAF